MKEQRKKRFPAGVLTAVITPFRDGEVDYPALSRILSAQEEGGASGIVLLGSTGESPTVLHDERLRMIRFTKEHTTLPLIVGTSSSDTKKAVAMTREAEAAGADALLVASPYYNRPTEDGMAAHFLAVAEHVHIPIMLYNIPARTGSRITEGVLRAVAPHPNISALKEADNNFSEIVSKAAMLRGLPPDQRIDLYAGNDAFYSLFSALGARGLVSVVSNAYPEFCRLPQDDPDAFLPFVPLLDALTLESNPIPIKTLMAAKGMIEEEFRLPLCKMREENKKRLLQIAAEY